MNEWEDITTKIMKAIDNVETTTKREQIIKLAIMMYLYKSLESEETFNNNCEILNSVDYEDIKIKKRWNK